MAVDLEKTKVIVELLRQTTSLGVMSDFLKARNLTSSASSWKEMLEKRLQPALERFDISNNDLIDLLRSVEECGAQHVFLYSCPSADAVQILDRATVTSTMRNMGISDLLTSPLVLEQPDSPKIVDVRWEVSSTGVDLNLVVKQVELRTYTKFIESKREGNKTYKIYDDISERVVNVAKLHRNGLLEIRIASHDNSSKYEDDIYKFWNIISPIFPEHKFSELSFSIAKERLWAERAELTDLVRHSDSTLRDDKGNVLRAATGKETDDLGSHAAVASSLDYLLENDDNAYCDSTNFWFKKTHGLSGDIHVVLAGENNEFALPSRCSAKDYQYAIDQLRFFNQPVS